MAGKGDWRRPEADKGAFQRNWERVFGKQGQRVLRAAERKLDRELREDACSDS